MYLGIVFASACVPALSVVVGVVVVTAFVELVTVILTTVRKWKGVSPMYI